MSGFPDGFTPRAPHPADIPEITAVYRAGEERDEGEPYTTEIDMRSEWGVPGYHPARTGLAVCDRTGRIVAHGEFERGSIEAMVHPNARGRGVGSAMLAWFERRALQIEPAGAVALGQSVCTRAEDAMELFRRRGYEAGRTAWVFRLPPDVVIPQRPLPEGFRIRAFDAATEAEQVHALIAEAFAEWQEGFLRPFGDWRATTIEREDFDPELLLVAVEGPREDLVGAAVCLPTKEEGWVPQIAVRRDRRGLGIGRALLREGFEGFRARGLATVGLATDSRTGAKDLYLKLGMVVHMSFTHWTKQLRGA